MTKEEYMKDFMKAAHRINTTFKVVKAYELLVKYSDTFEDSEKKIIHDLYDYITKKEEEFLYEGMKSTIELGKKDD
jgi:hypothetical protein